MKGREKNNSVSSEHDNLCSVGNITIQTNDPPPEFPRDQAVIYFRTRGTTESEGDYLMLNSDNEFILAEDNISRNTRWRLHFTTSGGQNAGYKFENVSSSLFMVLNEGGQLTTSSTSDGYWQMWKAREGGNCVGNYLIRWLSRNSPTRWLVVTDGNVSVEISSDIDDCRASWDWQPI